MPNDTNNICANILFLFSNYSSSSFATTTTNNSEKKKE